MRVDKHGRHTAAILSQETEMALFYHPLPRSEKIGSEARQVIESCFSLSGQNGCLVTKTHGVMLISSLQPWNIIGAY